MHTLDHVIVALHDQPLHEAPAGEVPAVRCTDQIAVLHGPVVSPDVASAPVDDRLVAELAEMVEVDQGVGAAREPGVFAHRMTLQERVELQRVRVTNTDRLRAIVAEFGWPGRMLVGEQGAEDAWLIAQHADHQLDSQRLFLKALQAAVDAGDAPARHVAYLTDRVAMNEGRPQTYGTQIAEVANGEGVAWPIRDPEQLDERRARIGLPTFAEYVAQWRGLR